MWNSLHILWFFGWTENFSDTILCVFIYSPYSSAMSRMQHKVNFQVNWLEFSFS